MKAEIELMAQVFQCIVGFVDLNVVMAFLVNVGIAGLERAQGLTMSHELIQIGLGLCRQFVVVQPELGAVVDVVSVEHDPVNHVAALAVDALHVGAHPAMMVLSVELECGHFFGFEPDVAFLCGAFVVKIGKRGQPHGLVPSGIELKVGMNAPTEVYAGINVETVVQCGVSVAHDAAQKADWSYVEGMFGKETDVGACVAPAVEDAVVSFYVNLL